MKPTLSSQVQSQGTQLYNGGKLLTNDLDSSLANLVGSKSFSRLIYYVSIAAEHYTDCDTCTDNVHVVFVIDLHFGGPPAKK